MTDKKQKLPAAWQFPWERYGWRFYLKGTKKEVFRVRLAHKNSAEAEQITKYIQAALNAYDD